MDAIGADEDVAIMCAPVGAMKLIRVLENEKFKTLHKSGGGSEDLGQKSPVHGICREYLQVNCQRPVVIAINTFELLRSVHAVRRHACKQLAEEGSAVDDGSDLAAILAVRAYRTDEVAFLGALTHPRLDAFLRDGSGAPKAFSSRGADQFQCFLRVAGHPHSCAGFFKSGGRLEDVHI